MKEEHGQQTRELQIPSMYYRYNKNITLKILLFFTLSLVHKYRPTVFVIDSQSEENWLKSGMWAEPKQFESIRKRKKLVYAVNHTKLVYLKSFKPP